MCLVSAVFCTRYCCEMYMSTESAIERERRKWARIRLFRLVKCKWKDNKLRTFLSLFASYLHVVSCAIRLFSLLSLSLCLSSTLCLFLCHSHTHARTHRNTSLAHSRRAQNGGQTKAAACHEQYTYLYSTKTTDKNKQQLNFVCTNLYRKWNRDECKQNRENN